MTSPIANLMQGPLCGTFATMLLYGVFCMQTFYYARNYTEDKLSLKWLVTFMWILETAHMALSIHFIEYYLIINFDNQPALDYVVWSMGATFAVGFIVAWAVDLCFVWRIWKLSKQSLICIFLAALATSRTAVGLVNCVLGFRYTYVPEFLVMVFPTMVAGWALAAFADSLIAIVLCYYLHKHRSGMKRTEHIINRLLLYTVNTGALTSVFAITTMILYLSLPDSLVFAAFVQVQSKLYAISLLASLNTRKTMLAQARIAVPTTRNVSLQFQANNGGVNRMDNQYSLDETMPSIDITKNIQMDVRSDEESL